MEKSKIKQILREAIFEAQPLAAPKKDNKKYEKDYDEVQNKLKDTLLKASQVMAAAGLGDPDDATDRSLFSKKLRKAKNSEGGQYLFNDKELASLVKVLNNPTAYLGAKK